MPSGGHPWHPGRFGRPRAANITPTTRKYPIWGMATGVRPSRLGARFSQIRRRGWVAMALYLVDRDLPGITLDQLAAARRAAIATSAELTAAGTPVRYVRSTFLPLDARCLCLFEASSVDLVEKVNQVAQIPFIRISEAVELTE